MLGSVLFYALYPFTRVVVKVSESLVKAASWILMNGKEEWDTGGMPPQSLTKRQSALLDEWLGQSSLIKKSSEETAADGESKCLEEMEEERMEKEVSVDSGCITCPADEDIFREREAESIRPDTISNMQEAVVQPDSDMLCSDMSSSTVTEGDACQEGIKTDDVEMMPLVTQGADHVSTNDNQEDTGLVANLALTNLKTRPHTDSRDHVSTNDNQEDTGSEANFVLAGFETLLHTDSRDAQRRLISDCPAMDLGVHLTETQTWSSHTQFMTHAEMPGWHFPVGHGLTEVVYRPYWQFPTMSYYPTLQESMEFEVMWRVWEDLRGSQKEVPQTTDQGPESVFEFTFMTYNILAQDLLEGNPELYIHCSEKVLVWSTRLKGIIIEIQTWRPDILCLQEAQEDHFKKQLQPVLSEMGYTCVYKRRTGSKTDGCAVCYQNKRFSQLSVSLLELRQQKCELLDRDNVAIVALLQPITSTDHDQRSTPICVANTHLLFNPRRGDIKLAQLVLVLAEIDSVVRRCKAIGRECEVIFCGDFNSFPNMPLYQFVSTGQLYYHGLPTWMISGQEDLSHQMHPRRVHAPLLPSCLGITDYCQHVTTCQAEPPPQGKLKYSQDFLLNLRYCQAACVRPRDLEVIAGVTDNAPDHQPTTEKQPCGQRFRKTVCHCLNLTSAYSHIITGTDRPEVTTVHSNAGATVDYIFYSARNAQNKGQTVIRPHGGLEVIGRLALLSEEDVWALRGLPNEVFPSDHLSLLVKFRLHINQL